MKEYQERRVSYVDPQVSPETRTAKARIEFRNPRGDLRLGMYAARGVCPVLRRIPAKNTNANAGSNSKRIWNLLITVHTLS